VHPVTVVVPTFNRASLLVETLNAIFAQTRPVSSVLVVNDGSTDQTMATLASFAGRISLINKTNTGKADSLNQALAAIPSGRVWIVDDDDLLRPDAHELLAGLLDANPDADLAYGRHMRFVDPEEGAPRRWLGTGYWGDDDPDRFFVSTLEDMFVHQPAMIVDRRLYDRAGPFDVSNKASEDYDMLVRLAQVATPVSTTKIVFDQRVHQGLRGPEGARWSLDDRDAKWIHYDQIAFRRLRGKLPLEEYLPFSQRAAGPMREEGARQALFQRATVMARRKLWPEAMADLDSACKITPARPLTGAETGILRRMLLGKFGCDELAEPRSTVLAELRSIKTKSRLSRAAINAVTRSLPWHVKYALQTAAWRRSARMARTYALLRITF
jgi:glycosyltransferase involved in cell wall biosynthesis